jgi:hypothetical protein
MIHVWWSSSMLFDEMHHWASAIDDLLDNDPVYLRYVGMTTGEDVTSRHFQDLSQRKLGLLSSFYSYLSKHLPNVLSRTTTMETHWHSDVTKTIGIPPVAASKSSSPY